MGAGGSMPTNSRTTEPPPLPPPFVTQDYLFRSSRNSGVSEESNPRTASRASTITLGGPQSQGPSPYATLRREEWWHHRPSAPSLPSLNPQQETLLTYAAQMTGWQSNGGQSSSTSQQEVMELSRTVSHLAAANQQLASAHSMTLAHLESLYMELRREREYKEEMRKLDQVKIGTQKRMEEEDEDDKREMRLHVARLESLLAEKTNFFHAQQSLQRDEEEQLRSKMEKLEELLAEKNDQSIKVNVEDEEKMELRMQVQQLESILASGSQADAEVEENRQLKKQVHTLETMLAAKNSEGSMKNSSTTMHGDEGSSGPITVDFLVKRQSQDVVYKEALARIEELENQLSLSERKGSSSFAASTIDSDLNNEYQKAEMKIRNLEEELKDLRNLKVAARAESNLQTKYNMAVDRMVRLETELRQVKEIAEEQPKENLQKEDSEEIVRLLGEIEKLKTDRLEYQEINRKLRTDLETQKTMIDKLREDYKISKNQYEQVEVNLNERQEKFNRLSDDFDQAKKETTKLLQELNAFQQERDTANARISNLEQDLQKSIFEKAQIKMVESQKSAKLRAQLTEEVNDKKKQIKALEDALEEIRRLKDAVKAEKKNSTYAKESIESEGASALERSLEAAEEVAEEVPEDLANIRSTNMEEFRKELTLKREARQRAIAAVSSEMDRLRRELDAEKEAHSETSRMLDLLKSGEGGPVQRESCPGSPEDEEELKRLKKEMNLQKDNHEETLRRIEVHRITDTLKVSDELKNAIRYQTEKVDDLRYQLECERDGNQRQILKLKEAANASREILHVRERQVNKLKDQLAQILARLGDSNYESTSDDVRAEYDHQLENIRNLRTLYEERLKVLMESKDNATKELVDTKEKLEIFQKKCYVLEEDLKKSEEKVDSQDTEISNLESQLGLTKADCRDLQNQMSVINSLFTQMLLSASSADMDLDRLTRLLQENHDLITEMAREEGTEAAALPKLLLDLVEQVEGRNRAEGSGNDSERKEEDIQEGSIAHNLPKVWRVLLELLSCHAVGAPVVSASESSAPDSCYKSVDTPTGPRLVISVSKTYIRLKELILEKKHLEKEMNRMKQLNTHLESRLGEQEKRLSTVSAELSKTWNVVGRMQAQHQQLHTHEKILRYELQQKRKMLQELKQELEYCREKWESARQKNTNTEIEWRSLRREFAARKALVAQDSFNNSGESGFSDERGDDSDEEDDAVEERVRISPRRRARKESPRVPTPDTESEQPTDTELSESKTGSSMTLEQRSPTPETEAEVDAEIIDADSVTDVRPPTPEPDCTPDSEPLNPLDRALTNVIQSLIETDHKSDHTAASTSQESTTMPTNSSNFRDWSSVKQPKSETVKKRTVKRDARAWSPHSEPWSSKVTGLDRSTPSSGRFPGVQDPPSGSTEPLPSLVPDVDLFKVVAQPLDVSVDQTADAAKPDIITSASEVGGCVLTNYQTGGKMEPAKTEDVANVDGSSISTVSVFSIGPFPNSKAASPAKSVQFSDPLIMGPSPTIAGAFVGMDSTVGESPGTSRSNDILDNCSGAENTREKTVASDELKVDENIVPPLEGQEDKSPSTENVSGSFEEVDSVSVKSSPVLTTSENESLSPLTPSELVSKVLEKKYSSNKPEDITTCSESTELVIPFSPVETSTTSATTMLSESTNSKWSPSTKKDPIVSSSEFPEKESLPVKPEDIEMSSSFSESERPSSVEVPETSSSTIHSQPTNILQSLTMKDDRLAPIAEVPENKCFQVKSENNSTPSAVVISSQPRISSSCVNVPATSSSLLPKSSNIDNATTTREDRLPDVPNISGEKSLPVKHEEAATGSTSSPQKIPSSSVKISETSTSAVQPTTSKPTRSPEEVFAARSARLKRLEEQADWLMKKMNATSQRGSALSDRLQELHEVYGEPPAPPPLPDVLPNVRLQSDLDRDPAQQVPQAPPMPRVLPPRRLSTEKDASESPPNNAP